MKVKVHQTFSRFLPDYMQKTGNVGFISKLFLELYHYGLDSVSNQWTGFYIIRTFVMKELTQLIETDSL